MNQIKVLSEEVANRIAAGEVVERPASVVKELVENAIDSGARSITVEVEAGGKKLIRITDDGCGMTEDDALTAFERHATSKIRTVNDIFSISTLGFRGEALPSIASVARLTMITRTEEDDLATRLEFDGGVLRDLDKTSANRGTSITVKSLFANVPARRNFLKSEKVEYKHIINYVHYQALVYPHIHIRLYHNGKQRLNYPSVDGRKKRMLTIFGSSFEHQDMIPLDFTDTNIRLSGYIKGLEETPAVVADYRYLFVNGRYIRDKIVMHAIRSAYEPFVKKIRSMRDQAMPAFILFLEVEPEKVDFNVHPAKLEIRFRDGQMVHSFVKSSINVTLMEYEDAKFNSVKSRLHQIDQPARLSTYEKKVFESRQPKKAVRKSDWQPLYQPEIFAGSESSDPDKTPPDNTSGEQPQRPRPIPPPVPEEDLVNPWQLHNAYVLFQVEDGLMMIDQHAAHERYLYEKIIHRIHGAPAPRQKLLFPIVVDIPPIIAQNTLELIEDNLEDIQRTGFTIRKFSGNSIVVDEIPAELEGWDGGQIFVEILSQLQDEFQETSDFRDSLAKSISCKAALKAGKPLGRREMITLINNLFACKVPYFCPHGRPLLIKFTLNELEKRFKRIET